jgi:hypothetical protein
MEDFTAFHAILSPCPHPKMESPPPLLRDVLAAWKVQIKRHNLEFFVKEP